MFGATKSDEACDIGDIIGLLVKIGNFQLINGLIWLKFSKKSAANGHISLNKLTLCVLFRKINIQAGWARREFDMPNL